MTDTDVQTRQREIATEHLLFKLIEYVEARHPGLLDYLEDSLDHLGDPARDTTKDDDGVRAIAQRMIAGARRETTGG
ncbi:hypothetical protein J2Y58_001908 [Sphingomonas sp. BE138]|uniref:hypothetical protein n=1 Tax=Sphingomonas sp. BE138 TaxID=2817845 RepID=UPI00285CDFAD|nr:hypothetical protein [Sphingomonas sp. BE138]MDR6788548.1 hypothetical protein [Sphingomonas sp. BE138]